MQLRVCVAHSLLQLGRWQALTKDNIQYIQYCLYIIILYVIIYTYYVFLLYTFAYIIIIIIYDTMYGIYIRIYMVYI